MAIDVPTAGDPILDTWGAEVATRLNQLVPYILASNLNTNDGTTGETIFSIPVVSGRAYNINLAGTYDAEETNQGIEVFVDENDALGSAVGGLLQYCTSGPTTVSNERIIDDWIGSTSTDTADVSRFLRIVARFLCATTGTLLIRFRRGGTSGGDGITIQAGFGGLVIETEV